MRRHVWTRVVSRRRWYLEALPGVVLSVLSVGAVSAAVATQPLGLNPQTGNTTGSDSSEQTVAAGHSGVKKSDQTSKDKAKSRTVDGVFGAEVVELGAPLLNTVDSLVPRQMWFIPTPTTSLAAKDLAQDAAAQLAALSRAGVQSLAVMEPTVLGGGIVDFTTYRSGGYDAALNTFYAELKNRGITDQAMGMWVIMPEANMPEWGQSDPDIISACIAKTAQLQKQTFPKSLVSVMLNSQTYPGNDTSYSHGEYKSLSPYVQSVPKGLIDSFGYQGFPWAPPANQPGPSDVDPPNYLRINLAAEGARAAGTASIWFNTGTFRKSYVSNPSQTITMASDKRAQLLQSVLNQAKQLKGQGFSMAVNIFAGDKSASAEGIDWSYPAGADLQVYSAFSDQLRSAAIGSWRYTGN